jgi:large subunit ribosomal protein L28
LFSIIFRIGEEMSRTCQITGVKPKSGHSISHAHNKSKRRFLPNLQKKRIWVKELGRFVTVKLTTRALRTIAKNGTAELAQLVRENKI